MSDLSNELTPDEIGAILSGEADDILMERLKNHPELKKEITEAQNFDSLLRSSLSAEKTSIDLMELGEFHLNLLSPERTTEIETLLQTSPFLREELQHLTAFTDAGDTEFESESPTSDNPPFIFLKPEVINVSELPRVAGSGENRVVRFTHDRIELTLAVQKSYSENLLTGQLITDELDVWHDAEVRFDLQTGDVLFVKMDDTGYFELSWSNDSGFFLTITNQNGAVFLIESSQMN